MIEKTLNPEISTPHVQKELFHVISKDAGAEVAGFISENIPLEEIQSIIFYPGNGQFDNEVDYGKLHSIIDLRKVNFARDINLHFISINKLLPQNGIYTGCLESYDNRWKRIQKKVGQKFFWIFWILDVIFNRIFPKLKLTASLYKLITRNRYNVISLAETLGRAVYCGFEVIDFKVIDNLTYFTIIKNTEPKSDDYVACLGPLFRMKRVGKGGKVIGVYKFRTMHPYSEFLQDFVVKANGYDQAGKPRNDFRVTGWGKFFRKYWLYEIPQLLNVIRGDIGIVGVRPLSFFRFNQLPEDVKKERIKYRPGCIPPYVSLNMPDSIGNIQAEKIYFEAMKKHPMLTPIRYFFMALYNILTGKIKSA
jgi:hypothetical protein